MSLWTVGLVGICAVWAVAGDGGIKDADEERDGEGKCTCGGKDGSKEGKVEDGYDSAWGGDVANRTNELLVDGYNSAKINGAGSNGFTNGYDSVIVFVLMLWWYFL